MHIDAYGLGHNVSQTQNLVPCNTDGLSFIG